MSPEIGEVFWPWQEALPLLPRCSCPAVAKSPHQSPPQKRRLNRRSPPCPKTCRPPRKICLEKRRKSSYSEIWQKNGKQQFLAANVVPKTPKNDIPGTIVTRAVLAEETDGKWSELLRCDEYLKNAKGYLALTPLAAVAGWKVQYDQDPVKGIQLYFTPIKGPADPHVLPIGIAWNPTTKRYQSLDLSYQHFLMEKPTLDTARSVLR